MKWMVIVAAIALSGCIETESKYAGTWKDKNGSGEIIVDKDVCKWYMGKGYGLNCEIKGDVLVINQGRSFSEFELIRAGDSLYITTPIGGMKLYALASGGGNG